MQNKFHITREEVNKICNKIDEYSKPESDIDLVLRKANEGDENAKLFVSIAKFRGYVYASELKRIAKDLRKSSS